MDKAVTSIQRVGIVGLGLIGGSIGLDLQSIGLEVNGLVHKEKTANRARERHLANTISTNPQILSKCDLIILALPIAQLLNPPSELINALPENAVVTDVASVKAPILNTWKKHHKLFIPSHPMAGTNNEGVEAGERELFKNRPWVSTPDINSDKYAIDKVYKLANALNSQWITADAKLHDQAVALISHLPVLISSALIKTLDQKSNQSLFKLAKLLASSGFEDTSRVGGGNPTLGTAMMQFNTSSVIKVLESFTQNLEQFDQIIKDNDWQKLYKEFEQTKSLRSDIIERKSK